MAKGKKKKSRRQSLASKFLNAVGIAIGFARPIQIVFNNIGNPANILPKMLSGLTFGLSGEGGFDLDEGTKMYAPVAAAVGYGSFKSFLVRKFPIR